MSTDDALDMLEEVTARALHMGLGMVVYPVDEVEAVCAALRATRRAKPTLVTPAARAALEQEPPGLAEARRYTDADYDEVKRNLYPNRGGQS